MSVDVSTVGCGLRAGLSACDDAERRARLPLLLARLARPLPCFVATPSPDHPPGSRGDVTDLDVGAIFKECPCPTGRLEGRTPELRRGRDHFP
jgi:hypothetical protein